MPRPPTDEPSDAVIGNAMGDLTDHRDRDGIAPETTSDTASNIITTDAVVIGAGPVGLFLVFQLGLQEIHAELIDALPHVGGQCAELYPDKPIYDIPGLPWCSGAELAERLQRQMAPMRPGLHLGQAVTVVEPQGSRFQLETSLGRRFDAGSVFVAGGVGAFEARRFKLEGIEAFEGRQLHHRLPELEGLAGLDVVVLGGEEAAVETVLALTGDKPAGTAPASVTLLHRREVLKASPRQLEQVAAQIRSGRLKLVVGQATGWQADGQRLTGLGITHGDASGSLLPADQLLVRLGLSPRLGPIADWGLAMERKQLLVDTERFESSMPGIYAVGDINTYPGKKKLIVCGFHEATLAAFAAAARLYPDRPQHLQYTTTSSRLHRLLGVSNGTSS